MVGYLMSFLATPFVIKDWYTRTDGVDGRRRTAKADARYEDKRVLIPYVLFCVLFFVIFLSIDNLYI